MLIRPIFVVSCARYVRYEGICHVTSMAVTGFVMIKRRAAFLTVIASVPAHVLQRVEAVYAGDKKFTISLWVLWFIQIGSYVYFQAVYAQSKIGRAHV